MVPKTDISSLYYMNHQIDNSRQMYTSGTLIYKVILYWQHACTAAVRSCGTRDSLVYNITYYYSTVVHQWPVMHPD